MAHLNDWLVMDLVGQDGVVNYWSDLQGCAHFNISNLVVKGITFDRLGRLTLVEDDHDILFCLFNHRRDRFLAVRKTRRHRRRVKADFVVAYFFLFIDLLQSWGMFVSW